MTQKTTAVFAQMILFICGDCGHEEIRDARGTTSMRNHLAQEHGTVWEEDRYEGD